MELKTTQSYGLRGLIHRVLSPIHNVFTKKVNIVFYGPDKYHSLHLEPVIKAFEHKGKYHLHLIGDFNKDSSLDWVHYYDNESELPLYKKYLIYLSTELSVPYWIKSKAIFFGHGIGPKLNYQSSSALESFDYSFSPCAPIYEAQKQKKINCLKVGLPILDFLENQQERVYHEYGFTKGLPLVVYAPSWSKNPEDISDIHLITSKLNELRKFNFIVCPHPNLVNPSLNQKDHIPLGTKHINMPGSQFSTLDLCNAATIVISDISSIFYEAMALGKLTIFDGNKEFYISSGAEDTLNTLSQFIPTLNWNINIELQLIKLLEDTTTAGLISTFVDDYLYNKGSATAVFLKNLQGIINND